jgi:hypothetical protein
MKSLKGLLDKLRDATNRTLRKRTSVRGGLQEPQRMQPVPAPVRVRS